LASGLPNPSAHWNRAMKSVIGAPAIRERLPEILYDESRLICGTPSAAYFPESIDDIREIVLRAHRDHTPLTIIGGKTGIAGGSVPTDGSIALCLSAMNQILHISRLPDGSACMLCRPGIMLSAIDDFLANPAAEQQVPGSEHVSQGRYFYPPDPTELSAQLGGTVATNASGARSFHYGATRVHVESLKIILADGEALSLRRNEHPIRNGYFSVKTETGKEISIRAPSYVSPRLKNASGYYADPAMDLLDLFIGSEGTLGIIAEIGIRIRPKPDIMAGLSFFDKRDYAVAFAGLLRTDPAIAAIEYFDSSALDFLRAHAGAISLKIADFPAGKTCALFWERIESPADSFDTRIDLFERQLSECGSSLDATWSGADERESARLKEFRHAVPELINQRIAQAKRECPAIRKVSTDTAVPGDVFETVFNESVRMIEDARCAYVAFGHIGDYHLHFNMLPSNQAEMDRAVAVYQRLMDLTIKNRGTVSAEHGVGKLKVPYLRAMYGDAVIAEMKRIKSELDPHWVMSRGNLFEFDEMLTIQDTEDTEKAQRATEKI